jgi:hypothetical protein
MAPLSNDQLADWRVTLRAVDVAGLPRTHDVKAVYRTGDDILEGWTLLKGVAHKIVFMVRDDVVASIERTSEPAAAVVLPGTGGIAGASSSPPGQLRGHLMRRQLVQPEPAPQPRGHRLQRGQRIPGDRPGRGDRPALRVGQRAGTYSCRARSRRQVREP